MTASFAYKLKQGGENIYLVTGGRDNTQRFAWYYVRIDARKKIFFEYAIKSGQIALTDFGDVLRSGYGETPPQEARDYMYQQYGFEG